MNCVCGIIMTPRPVTERSVKDVNGHPMILFYTGISIFSNFHPAPLDICGQQFENTEQYYQYRKALYFNDIERANAILKERRPGHCKRLAKSIKNFDRNAWNMVAPIVMMQALLYKFRQNPNLRQHLLASGAAVLVEASPFDNFWGNGLDINDHANMNRDYWKGHNILGEILMCVREYLRCELYYV